jgi:PKHD-type hydroxylase
MDGGAGPISPHKHNTEAPHQTPEAQAASDIALKALRRHPQFFNAALPAIMSPLMMNRYVEGMDYGDHCDAAVLGGSTPMRADLSATLFISEPADYDGGELVTHIMPEGYRTKLPAGDLVLYPADTVHHVTKVTRGTRLAIIFWTQSMVRDLQQRTLLYNLSQTLDRRSNRASRGMRALYRHYNLIRMCHAARGVARVISTSTEPRHHHAALDPAAGWSTAQRYCSRSRHRSDVDGNARQSVTRPGMIQCLDVAVGNGRATASLDRALW